MDICQLSYPGKTTTYSGVKSGPYLYNYISLFFFYWDCSFFVSCWVHKFYLDKCKIEYTADLKDLGVFSSTTKQLPARNSTIVDFLVLYGCMLHLLWIENRSEWIWSFNIVCNIAYKKWYCIISPMHLGIVSVAKIIITIDCKGLSFGLWY